LGKRRTDWRPGARITEQGAACLIDFDDVCAITRANQVERRVVGFTEHSHGFLCPRLRRSTRRPRASRFLTFFTSWHHSFAATRKFPSGALISRAEFSGGYRQSLGSAHFRGRFSIQTPHIWF